MLLVVATLLTQHGTAMKGHKKQPRRASLTSCQLEALRANTVNLHGPTAHPPRGMVGYHRAEGCVRDGASILSPTYSLGWRGVMPELLHITESTGFWPTNAMAMSNADLMQAACNLLLTIQEAIEPQCKLLGFGDGDELGMCYPLIYSLMEQWRPEKGGMCHGCMLVMPGCHKLVPNMIFNANGYAHCYMGTRSKHMGKAGKQSHELWMYVHRLVCWLFHGMPPSSRHVCLHLCGYSNCLNPYHLCWGTQADNYQHARFHTPPTKGGVKPRCKRGKCHPMPDLNGSASDDV